MLSGEQRIEDAARREDTRAQSSYYNRRVAAAMANFTSAGFGAGDDTARFFCTCGRPGCDETLLLSLREYAHARQSRNHFLIAPHHDTEADVVIAREPEYWVVEVKPDHRIEG